MLKDVDLLRFLVLFVSHVILLPNKHIVRKIHTNTLNQRAGAQKQYINSFLTGLDLLTHNIYNPNQAHVGLDEGILGVSVQLLALHCDAIGSLLRATDVVDARFSCKTGEFFKGVFANAAGTADEDSDKAGRERRRDAIIGRLDSC